MHRSRRLYSGSHDVPQHFIHLAVANGLPHQDSKGRAPSIYQAVEHLESEGVITKKMRPWADRIKDRGNEANHVLGTYSVDEVMDVATFTRQLLQLAYELPALMDTGGADDTTIPNHQV